MELLVSVDSEIAAITEIRASLVGSAFASAKVGTKIPSQSPKPRQFVRVISAGGSERDLVTDEALLTLEAFCDDEGDARDLAALLVAIVQRAGRLGRLGGCVCFGVDVAGLPANLPHPDIPDRFRYTATVSAALRRVAA